MTRRLRFTVLGCGSSGGVPRIGRNWGQCNPLNPRNRRRRCSLLIQLFERAAQTAVLVDTSPDMREQLLAANVGCLDGVVYTHGHADHVNGLDDLRMVYHVRGSRVPVWADRRTAHALQRRFNYAFTQPENSSYPPILDLHPLGQSLQVSGAGGTISIRVFPVRHGSIDSVGLRVEDLAYVPDVSALYETSWEALEGIDCWIVDALRRRPHPSHTHLARTLKWIRRVGPRHAYLTNMHIDLDYEAVDAETPENVSPAHDGLVIEYEV